VHSAPGLWSDNRQRPLSLAEIEGKKTMPRRTSSTPKKGRLLSTLAKTTGTTVGEARGIMSEARRDIRAGRKGEARSSIRRALSGGPTAGAPRTPSQAGYAKRKSASIVSRIARNQRAEKSLSSVSPTDARRKRRS
jgi:hypothetical protein